MASKNLERIRANYADTARRTADEYADEPMPPWDELNMPMKEAFIDMFYEGCAHAKAELRNEYDLAPKKSAA